MKFFIQFLIVFALVTGSISPACDFMGAGGKGWIEICASDGTVKRIKVDAEQSPFPTDQTEQQIPSHTASMDDCSFCFSSNNLKAVNVNGFAFSNPLNQGYLKISGGVYAPQSFNALNFQPRAPPVFS